MFQTYVQELTDSKLVQHNILTYVRHIGAQHLSPPGEAEDESVTTVTTADNKEDSTLLVHNCFNTLPLLQLLNVIFQFAHRIYQGQKSLVGARRTLA